MYIWPDTFGESITFQINGKIQYIIKVNLVLNTSKMYINNSISVKKCFITLIYIYILVVPTKIHILYKFQVIMKIRFETTSIYKDFGCKH